MQMFPVVGRDGDTAVRESTDVLMSLSGAADLFHRPQKQF